MEEGFPYQETPDQVRAIDEVKADMERARPMDRLVCGDVGYGKTEVALRAAFKAVLDQRQVAVLAPTTMLAQQHFNTFSQRLGPIPCASSCSAASARRRSRRRRSRPGGGRGGHRHRHAPPAPEGRRVQGPGPAGDRRGAALRRRAQGAAEADARRGGRADADRDADPAHAAHGAGRACAT